MQGNFIEKDVMIVSGWAEGVEYPPKAPGQLYNNSYGVKRLTVEETFFRDKAIFEANKPELMIASIPDATGYKCDAFRPLLENDGWHEAGWYPTIHNSYLQGYGVHLFFKLNKEGKLGTTQSYYKWSGGGLGCSVGMFSGKTPIRVGRATDYAGGYTAGQKRLSIWRWELANGPTMGEFKKNGYYKFATTSLAKYFIYAIKPGEERGTVEK